MTLTYTFVEPTLISQRVVLVSEGGFLEVRERQVDSHLPQTAPVAHSLENTLDVFSKGSYKGPVMAEQSSAKRMVYGGEVPAPRPGAVNTN